MHIEDIESDDLDFLIFKLKRFIRVRVGFLGSASAESAFAKGSSGYVWGF